MKGKYWAFLTIVNAINVTVGAFIGFNWGTIIGAFGVGWCSALLLVENEPRKASLTIVDEKLLEEKK
jgi:hypothetical protein